MKRMNILLSRRFIFLILAKISAFAIGLPLLIGCFGMVLGQGYITMGYVRYLILFLMGVYITIFEYRYHPFYVEYDDEKIIAHYLLGITATVWKNRDIYTGVFYPQKGIPLLIYSNTSFPVSSEKTNIPHVYNTKLTVNDPDTFTQIALPLQSPTEMLGLPPSHRTPS